MQTTKMSLANIKGKLSRDEMKKIMAGSGDDGIAKCPLSCSSIDCTGTCTCFHGGTVNQYCGTR